MGFSTALLALAHVLAANAACDSLPSCGTCLANSGCGWCASSTSCMSIASDGTVEGTCSDFQGSQCVGGSRDSNSFRTLPSRLNSASACMSCGPAQSLTGAPLTVAGEPCSYYTTCNSCTRVPFCMFNNANGRCEFLCAPPSSSARLHHTRSNTPQHSTTPPRPPSTCPDVRRPANGKQPAARYTAYGASCGQ